MTLYRLLTFADGFTRVEFGSLWFFISELWYRAHIKYYLGFNSLQKVAYVLFQGPIHLYIKTIEICPAV